jgi:hypothetical protein
MFALTGEHPSKSTRPVIRLAKVASVGLVVAVTAFGFGAGAASAAGSNPDNGDTTAYAQVDSGITLTSLTSAFMLTGTPGATVSTGEPVTYNVETNNVTGYTVSVQAAGSTMLPENTVANADTIPIADLTVRESGVGEFAPVTAVGGNAVLVHAQDGRSANGGDNLSTDFRMRIPTVNADTYSATLNYLAAPVL